MPESESDFVSSQCQPKLALVPRLQFVPAGALSFFVVGVFQNGLSIWQSNCGIDAPEILLPAERAHV
jgi:hypothetical protein